MSLGGRELTILGVGTALGTALVERPQAARHEPVHLMAIGADADGSCAEQQDALSLRVDGRFRRV